MFVHGFIGDLIPFKSHGMGILVFPRTVGGGLSWMEAGACGVVVGLESSEG